jgi:hypothetical protein
MALEGLHIVAGLPVPVFLSWLWAELLSVSHIKNATVMFGMRQ